MAQTASVTLRRDIPYDSKYSREDRDDIYRGELLPNRAAPRDWRDWQPKHRQVPQLVPLHHLQRVPTRKVLHGHYEDPQASPHKGAASAHQSAREMNAYFNTGPPTDKGTKQISDHRSAGAVVREGIQQQYGYNIV